MYICSVYKEFPRYNLSIEIKDHKFWRFKTLLYNHPLQNLGTSLNDFYIPYSGKISRAKIFEVGLPQNISRIKFQGSTRLSLHLYAIIRFSRINFRGSSEIHENSEIYHPRKIPAIRYLKLCSVATPMLYCKCFSSYKAR